MDPGRRITPATKWHMRSLFAHRTVDVHVNRMRRSNAPLPPLAHSSSESGRSGDASNCRDDGDNDVLEGDNMKVDGDDRSDDAMDGDSDDHHIDNVEGDDEAQDSNDDMQTTWARNAAGGSLSRAALRGGDDLDYDYDDDASEASNASKSECSISDDRSDRRQRDAKSKSQRVVSSKN